MAHQGKRVQLAILTVSEHCLLDVWYIYMYRVLLIPTGGGLVLAEGGLCLLGNISTMKKDHRDKLERSKFYRSCGWVNCEPHCWYGTCDLKWLWWLYLLLLQLLRVAM